MPVYNPGPPRENNNNSTGGPPTPNPVVTAYESYLRDTPLITRYVLNATAISYITGFVFNPAYLLANIPTFTIYKFQLYRIITSPMICTDILSLFFTFMGFMNHGVKLEQLSVFNIIRFYSLCVGVSSFYNHFVFYILYLLCSPNLPHHTALLSIFQLLFLDQLALPCLQYYSSH